MKKVTSVLLLLSVLMILSLSACGQKAETEAVPTWQEQYDLGVRYLSEGNYEEAILAFTAAIEIDPKNADAYIGLTDAHIFMGDVNMAVEVLTNALNTVEDMTDIQIKLDKLSTQAGKDTEPKVAATLESEVISEPETETEYVSSGAEVVVHSQAELDALVFREDVDQITCVHVQGGAVSDISALRELKNLTSLTLFPDNGDISPIYELTNLTHLGLIGSIGSDISALGRLTNLTSLSLIFNNISDISALSGLKNLTSLNLAFNNISDVSALSGLTNLTSLYLGDNDLTQQQIDDLQVQLPKCSIDSTSVVTEILNRLN